MRTLAQDKSHYKIFILVFLGLLTAFGPFVTDMYLASPAVNDRMVRYPRIDGTTKPHFLYGRTGCRATIFRSDE